MFFLLIINCLVGRNQRVSQQPLIRLNVKCCDERQVFNTIRFGQNYIGKVANPDDMVKCNLPKERTRSGKDSNREINAVCYLSSFFH